MHNKAIPLKRNLHKYKEFPVDNLGLSLSKGLSDVQIHNAMKAKLKAVRKELGLV